MYTHTTLYLFTHHYWKYEFFNLLVTVSNATMNRIVQRFVGVSFQLFVAYISRSRTAESYGNFMFNFSWYCYTFSQKL